MDLAEADADAFMEKFGELAYDEARRRSREAERSTVLDGNRPHGHWALVRKIIGERQGRDGLDTATRYLDR
jgi:hypothetical protein